MQLIIQVNERVFAGSEKICKVTQLKKKENKQCVHIFAAYSTVKTIFNLIITLPEHNAKIVNNFITDINC